MKALKHLAAKHLAVQQTRYPNTPAEFIPRPTYNDRTEKGLVACVIAWLTFGGHQAQQTGKPARVVDTRKEVQDILGRSRVIGSVTLINCNNPVNISASINGKAVNIKIRIGEEIPTATDKSGAINFVASSFQQFYDWYLTMAPEVGKKESGGLTL